MPSLLDPPDATSTDASNPISAALGEIYRRVTGYMSGSPDMAFRYADNPIGTETTRPHQTVGMPRDFVPAATVGGGLWGPERPIARADVDAFRAGSQNLYDQASLLAGSRGLFEPGGTPGGQVALPARRRLANPPPARGLLGGATEPLPDLPTPPPAAGSNNPPSLLGDAVVPAPGAADRISTRIPWAKGQTGDPHASADLTVGIDSSRASGDAYVKNARFIDGYSDIPTAGLADDPEALHQALISHARDNLLFLHDSIPAEIREQSKLWYDGANNIAQRWADQYGISPRQAAGTLAALSPQKDWFQNVSLAKRLLDIRQGQGATIATPEMRPWFDRFVNSQKDPNDATAYRAHIDGFEGKPLSEISDPEAQALWMRAFDEAHNPRGYDVVTPQGDFAGPALNKDGSSRKVGWGSLGEISKALGTLQEDSTANISQLMGANHKVRNFYNNIISPNSLNGDVTIDTHAIAAAHLRPLAGGDNEVKIGLGLSPGSGNAATGSKGLYGAYAEAYRQAAARLGILPRELQSITWEGVRGLYSDVQKRNKPFTDTINGFWNQHGNGEISANDARDASVRAAGGIDPPEWWRPGS